MHLIDQICNVMIICDKAGFNQDRGHCSVFEHVKAAGGFYAAVFCQKLILKFPLNNSRQAFGLPGSFIIPGLNTLRRRICRRIKVN